jgi:uncharacterized iron-regulated membrane protein
MLIRTGAGESRTAYVDPYDGRLLGTIPAGGVMQIVRKIHSLQYFGFWASCLVEIAAGWAIVLALSGIFLWWPRGRKGGVVTIRTTPKYRTFWRDPHAVTGLFVSGIVVFLAVTGMPWSKVWGDYVQECTTAAGLGRPRPPAEVVPQWQLARGKSRHEGHMHGGAAPAANLPWALEKTVPSQSMPSAQPSITLDQALATFLPPWASKSHMTLPCRKVREALSRQAPIPRASRRHERSISTNIAARFWTMSALPDMGWPPRRSNGASMCIKGRSTVPSTAMSC